MLAVLAVVAVALATTVAVQRSSMQQRRERELDLLFVGQQFRDAINHYAAAAPSSPGALAYPRTLDDLVEDHRFTAVARHLRHIYVDPMTGQRDWVLERVQDRIIGVHSRSDAAPIRRTGFLPEWEESFARARSYQEWRFVADAYQANAGGGGGAAGSGANSSTPTGSVVGNGTADGGNTVATDSGQASSTSAPDPSAIAQCQAQYGKAQRGSCSSPGMTPAASQQCFLEFQQNFLQCIQAAGGQ